MNAPRAKLPRWLLLLALLLPLATIGAGILRSERHLGRSQRWVIEITGYDPRDPLRGHYIDFRLNLRDEPGPVRCDGGPECCYCLERRGLDEPPHVVRTTCPLATECDGRLRVSEASQLRRYYIGEARAPELDATVREAALAGRAHVVVAIDADGVPQLVELRVDGVPIEGVAEAPSAP